MRPPTSESVMPAGVPEVGATTAERFQRLEDQAVRIESKLAKLLVAATQAEQRLRRADEQLEATKATLDAFIAGLGAEVRTRRLVVEDESGYVGLTASVEFGGGELRVSCPTGDGSDSDADTTAAIYAHTDSGSPEAGVFLSGAGDDCAHLHIREGETLANGHLPYYAELDLQQPNGDPGMILGPDGLETHPMRRYLEQCAWEERQRKAGRITTPKDVA